MAPRRGRDFRQGHRLEYAQAAQGGPVDHLGAVATAPRRGPAVLDTFTRVYRDGAWFSFVRFALLLAVVLCWVDRCLEFWVLLGFFCLVRVAHHFKTSTLVTRNQDHNACRAT